MNWVAEAGSRVVVSLPPSNLMSGGHPVHMLLMWTELFCQAVRVMRMLTPATVRQNESFFLQALSDAVPLWPNSNFSSPEATEREKHGLEAV